MSVPHSRTPARLGGGAVWRVLAVSVVLTIAMAWPVLRHPTERIFGGEIVGRHHDPFTVMQQFAGAPVGAAYLQPATDWIGRAFAVALPPVAAYNLLVLLTFPLAAWFAYVLAFEITGSTIASAFAAFAFAFSPFHLEQAAYHPHVAQVQWVPLYFFTLWRCARRCTWRRALALIAAGAVAVLANAYHALVLGAITPFALIAFWWTPLADRPRATWRDLVGTAGVLASTAAIAILAIHRVVPVVFSDRVAAAPDDLFIYAARWWSYLIPAVDHPLLGPWATRVWTSYVISDGLLEQQVFVGWTVVVLCAIALAAWWRRRGAWSYAPVLLGLAALAVVCSLSPERSVWGLTWSRPSSVLYALMPMFRSYGRFAVVVQCFASIVAGAAFAMLWSSGRRAVALAAVPLLMFEFLPGAPHTRDVLPTSAHRWVVEQGPAQAVFECAESSMADANVSWLMRRSVGHVGTVVADCGEPALAQKLRTLGFEYLLLRTDVPARTDIERQLGPAFSRVYQGADASVFAIAGAAVPVYVGALEGADRREYDGPRSWRWAGARVSVPLINVSASPQSPRLGLTLSAFGIPRQVRVTLDGVAVTVLRVPSEDTVFELGPLTLSPGQHQLVLESLEPALSPAAIGGGTDARLLALRIGRWWIAP